jgi:pSer/pThr/pTyr-binding forkhead associated (FHA) protein
MASLVVTEGPGQGTHFPLTLPLVSVGRDDTCTFQVLDPTVSRKHLQVKFDPTLGKHIAGDYRSAHGVYVNGRELLLDIVLSDGDKIRIGQTTLVYLAVDHADASAALAAAKKKDEWARSTMSGSELGRH